MESQQNDLRLDRSSTERSSIRIVVVGNSLCGKTSLITTLVSSTFPAQPPPVLQQVHIPPEETGDNVALCITDTSSDPKERESMLYEVSRADVVVLVYSAEEAADKSMMFGPGGQLDVWLHEISQTFNGPILIVGNKVDLVPKDVQSKEPSLQENVGELLEKYGDQVTVTWECSSKLNMNVSEVFHMAQHAVLYPLAPLFDNKSKELRSKFKKALCRIFRIFDVDRDGLLSDVELNDFQERCFGVRLTPTDIEQVKAVLQRQGTGLVLSKGISLEGFQFIFKTFINRNRVETSWLALRMFGYDDSLEIQIHPSFYFLKFKTTRQSVELSPRALQFFESLFHQYDRDKDGALSPTEMKELFSICPSGKHPWADYFRKTEKIANETMSSSVRDMPSQEQILPNLSDFPNGIKTRENGYVTLEGWLSQWCVTTLLQPQTTLLHLQYLGYSFSPRSAVRITRSRDIEDEENDLHRRVVRAFVFGATSVNKSMFLNALIGKNNTKKSDGQNFRNPYADSTGFPTSIPRDPSQNTLVRSVVASMKPRNSSGSKTRGSYLVLTEIPANKGILKKVFDSGMVDCDLAIMLFNTDDISSVEYLRSVQHQIPETVPCVYLYNNDRSESEVSSAIATSNPSHEGSESAAAKLCREHSLPDPEPVVLRPDSKYYSKAKVDRLFELLVTTALRPDAARPISSQRRAIRRRKRLLRATLRISFVSVAVVGVSWFVYSLVSNIGGAHPESSEKSKK